MAFAFAPAASPFVKARAKKPDDGHYLESPITQDSVQFNVARYRAFAGGYAITDCILALFR